MNLKNIQKIVSEPTENWEHLLLHEIAMDYNSLPLILQILDDERTNNKNLIRESNAELSRALVTLMDEKYAQKGRIVDRMWVAGEIKNHYLKWEEFIKCNFKIEGLP